jgi:hypothetical protein
MCSSVQIVINDSKNRGMIVKQLVVVKTWIENSYKTHLEVYTIYNISCHSVAIVLPLIIFVSLLKHRYKRQVWVYVYIDDNINILLGRCHEFTFDF